MTLFIKLPIYYRHDRNKDDSKNSLSVDCVKGKTVTHFGLSDYDGAQLSSSGASKDDKENSCDDNEFLSDPDLASVSFPQSSSLPKLTFLISPRPVSKRRKATTLPSGNCIVCVATSFDARVAGALITSCRWDGFRDNLIRSLIDVHDNVGHELSSFSTDVLVFVNLRWPSALPLDAAFSRRVLRLLHARLDLEVAMAWLSTLGGGFSALGDYYNFAAEKAQKISVAQMKLAQDMGDPIIAAKSWLWFSLALIQKGKIGTARGIVKRQLAFSRTKTGRLDPRLKRMCKGVMAKIKYLLSGNET